MVGYSDKTAGGLFVAGRSLANLTGVVLARAEKLGKSHGHGTIYYTSQSHSSLEKARRVIGIGPRNMRRVAIGTDGRIDLTDLRKLLTEDVAAGNTPFCIIGRTRTPGKGAADNLVEMRKIADEHNAWLHIDGTYGGATVLSKKYKHQVAGIELADSITLNPYNWCFQPLETGCILLRDKQTFQEGLAERAEYIYNIVKSEEQIKDSGVQLSRTLRALKLYACFRSEGFDKIGKQVTQDIERAQFL